MKGFVGLVFALATIVVGKTAFAADCRQPLIFKDGIQDYVGTTNTSGVVVRGSASLRIRLYCKNGTQGKVTSSDFPAPLTKPEVSETKSGTTVVLVSAFAEFEGEVAVDPGASKTLTFTDGSGATFTVMVYGKDKLVEQPAIDAVNGKLDGKADKSDLVGKANIGDSYTRPESDSRYEPLGAHFGSDGRTRLDLEPMAYFRTGGFDVAGGVQGQFTYHVGPVNETAFEVAAFAGYARGRIDNRGVVGVPLTEPSVWQDITWWGVMFQAGIPVGSRVDVVLGGGPFMRWIHVPDTNIGQAADGTVWNNHAKNDIEGGLALNLGVNFMLTGDERRGVYLGLGTSPQLPFMQSYHIDGGDKNVYAAAIDAHGTLGARF